MGSAKNPIILLINPSNENCILSKQVSEVFFIYIVETGKNQLKLVEFQAAKTLQTI